MIHNSFKAAFNLILPYRCLVTGEILYDSSGLSPQAWSELTFIANKQGAVCRTCGCPFSVIEEADYDETHISCVSCMDNPPHFKKAAAALIYNDHSRPLILGFKHGDKIFMSGTFASWMMSAGAEILKETDVLVPVPLHWRRLIKRRYNQSALLADALGKKVSLPVSKLALKRARATPTQGHLSAKDRRKNVKQAFTVSKGHKQDILGKNICLIDDVLTSGSTVNECARTLLDAGAKSVSVLCLARVADI